MITDKKLSITLDNGLITLVLSNGEILFIPELPLATLEKVYKKWQSLVKLLKDDLSNTLLKDKIKRKYIFDLLKTFGIPKPELLTISQIEALLFFYDSGDSLLWRLHKTFAEVDIPQTEENPINYGNYLPDLDLIETANLYLLQNDKLALKEWPLSKIMTLFNSKAFISWASNPDNRQKVLEKEFEKRVDENPLSKEDVLKMIGS